MLTALYSLELWYLNEEVVFWSEFSANLSENGEEGRDGNDGRTLEKMMMPGRLEMRIGAGESKVRNPRTRGCLVRTLVESLSTGFGVSFHYELAYVCLS